MIAVCHSNVVMHSIRASARAISAEFFQTLTWFTLRLTFLIVGKLTTSGWEENVKPLIGPVIFAPNHSNDMDSIFLRVAMPFLSHFSPLYYVTYPFRDYSSFERSPFVSLTYRFIPFGLIGAVPMVVGAHDYGKSLARHVALLKRGKSICIFPEGEVSKTGELGEPRGGVMYMGIATHAPIIPVTITGTFGLTRKKFFRERPQIHFHFGKPVYAADMVPDALPHSQRYREGTRKLFAYMTKAGV